MQKKHFIFGVGLLGIGAICAISPIVAASSTIAVDTVNMKANFSQPREITAEQKAEMLTRHQEMLTKQLENGNITQEQFDEMTTKIENGEIFTIRGNLQ